MVFNAMMNDHDDAIPQHQDKICSLLKIAILLIEKKSRPITYVISI